MSIRFRRTLAMVMILLAGSLVACGHARADEEKPASDPPKPVSYFRDVMPIFRGHCLGCHQPAKRDGELLLTTYEGLLKGGESEEPGIVAGHPEKSTLVSQIVPLGDDPPAMPKKGDPLSAEQVALVKRWIAEGAKDDTPARAKIVYNQQNPPQYNAPALITSLDFSPDGKLLAISGYHEVLLHAADGSGLVARLVGLSERIERASFSPDGKRLAVAGGAPGRTGEVQVWDLEKRKLTLSHAVTFDTVYGASWSPDGKLVAFGCGDNTVRAIESDTGKQVLYMGSHDDWALDTVFSQDGTQVISVSRDMTVKQTDLPTQRFVGNITTHTPGVLRGGMNAVARHPQSNDLLVGGADGAPKLFRMDTKAAPAGGGNPNQIREFAAMPGRVFDVCFNHDGSRVIAGSSFNGAGEVWVFDSGNGKMLVKLEGQQGGVYAVACSPDGKVIATGGFDGVVRLSDAAAGKLIKQFVPVTLAPDKAASAN